MAKNTNVQDLYAQRGEQLFSDLYAQNRDIFVAWVMKSFGCDKEDGQEIFQEAMVILYNKIDSMLLIEINSSLKTYLFAIGRNLMLRKFDEKKRIDLFGEALPEILDLPDFSPHELTDRQHSMKIAFQQLREGCQQLLTLFYYRNFVIDAIMHEMGFQSEEVVRTKKYKCLKQLKKIMTKPQTNRS